MVAKAIDPPAANERREGPGALLSVGDLDFYHLHVLHPFANSAAAKKGLVQTRSRSASGVMGLMDELRPGQGAGRPGRDRCGGRPLPLPGAAPPRPSAFARAPVRQ